MKKPNKNKEYTFDYNFRVNKGWVAITRRGKVLYYGITQDDAFMGGRYCEGYWGIVPFEADFKMINALEDEYKNEF